MDRRAALKFIGEATVLGLAESCTFNPRPPTVEKPLQVAPATVAPSPTVPPTPLPKSTDIPKPLNTPTPSDTLVIIDQTMPPFYKTLLRQMNYGLEVFDRRDQNQNPRQGVVIKPVRFYQYPPLWPNYDSIPADWKISPLVIPKQQNAISWTHEIVVKDLGNDQDLGVLISNKGNLMNLTGQVRRYGVMVWYPDDVRVAPST